MLTGNPSVVEGQWNATWILDSKRRLKSGFVFKREKHGELIVYLKNHWLWSDFEALLETWQSLKKNLVWHTKANFLQRPSKFLKNILRKRLLDFWWPLGRMTYPAFASLLRVSEQLCLKNRWYKKKPLVGLKTLHYSGRSNR